VASDVELPTPLNSSLFESEDLNVGLHNFYKKKIDAIYRSKSYKLGNFIVRPIDKLINMVKVRK